MKLSEALRLKAVPRLALVGAGGKTTALFQLAHELNEAQDKTDSFPVLVTCTAHLGLDQKRLVDYHYTLREPAEVDALADALPSGVILFTGPETGDERWSGVIPSVLERIYSLAERRELPLLIEADGSRMRPVKAPAAHEPPIPPFVDTVVVVAGLSAINQPLAAEWVHRPEIFASLAEIPIGAQINPRAIVRVLTHPQGGLKNIPEGARRLVLLNQADTPNLQAVASAMAGGLLADYHGVIIAALNPSAPSHVPPHITPVIHQAPSVFAVHERVAGVILAAGEASRFGQVKVLLEWKGKTFLSHVINAALEAGLSQVVVVSGAYTPQILQACTGLPVDLAHNPDWGEGQSTSLHAGLSVVHPEVGAAIFLLADQPQVPAGLIAALVETHAAGLPPIVAPLVDGQRANPTLFDRRTFPDLVALHGDVGGRAVFSKYPIAWVPWHDPSLLLDVDTPEDYQTLLAMGSDI